MRIQCNMTFKSTLTIAKLGQVVQQQLQPSTQTTLAFQVEQSKVLEYFGQKNKDTITAIISIQRINDLARTNNWSDTVTYTNVANTLKGFTREWLFATKCWTGKETSSPG